MLYDSGPFQPQIECQQLFFQLEGKQITKLLEETNNHFAKKENNLIPHHPSSSFSSLSLRSSVPILDITPENTPLFSSSSPLSRSPLSSTSLSSSNDDNDNDDNNDNNDDDGDCNDNNNSFDYEDDDDDDEEFEYCEGDGGDFSDDDVILPNKNGRYYFPTHYDECDNEENMIEEEEEISERDVIPPFWYSHEEIDQIREIFLIYQNKLIKDIEQSRSSRLFVGQIFRLDATCGQDFQTFDVVSVFNEQIGNNSPIIPFHKKYYIVTTWDRSDGLPINLFVIDEDDEDCFEFWRDRVRRKGSLPSCLTRSPHFLAKGEYVYSSSSIDDNQNNYYDHYDHDLYYQFGYQQFSKSQRISWC